MAKTIIHVNQHVIKSNRKHGRQDPVLTAKHKGKATYSHTAAIMHNGVEVARVVYRPDKPLGCGAHVWIETGMDVLYDP